MQDDWEDRIVTDAELRTGKDRFWAALNLCGVAILFMLAAGMARADDTGAPVQHGGVAEQAEQQAR